MDNAIEYRKSGFIWKIEDFHSCICATGCAVRSPSFVFEGSIQNTWCLGMYPHNDNPRDVGCYLYRLDRNDPEVILMDLEMCVVDTDNCARWSRYATDVSIYRNYGHGFQGFFNLDKLFSRKRSCLDQGALHIRCRVSLKVLPEGVVYCSEPKAETVCVDDIFTCCKTEDGEMSVQVQHHMIYDGY